LARVLGRPIQEARDLAYGSSQAVEIPVETIEEALARAHFFHAKGLSDADIAIIRPILEALDKQVETLSKD
jgi:5-bromo-4-chloroindolyl phosphate hydrolysis protein